MPFVQQASETERLYPPAGLPGVVEGDWVEIRRSFTLEMRRELLGSSLSVPLGTADAIPPPFDPFAYRQRLLGAVLVAWSDPAPVTPETIAVMHPLVGDWIAGEFERIAEIAGPAEAGEASAPSTTSLPASRARNRRLPGS